MFAPLESRPSTAVGTANAMLQIGLWSLSIGGIAVLLAAAAWGMHRFCIALEDRGYLYYRTRPQGGGIALSGMLTELDRLARPSVQHVLEVNDESCRKQNEDEGEAN